ncbi:MAG: indole-3-glycerol phosphate synthase TrpC [Lachnospiraceae bacterium]|nr:indole-3-glycerol phosphate synthase TrpC [Ruminococcus sp.]MCM1273825.1 indole-3-glycerol phosphate synthase TrpC [Lachnospiraceae bacterium]
MILDEIAAKTRERIAEKAKEIPLSEVRSKAESMPRAGDFPFERALSASDISFICEVKKASPSKGVIAEDFPYLQIARDYEAAGAAAISCLTEPFWFKGSDAYLHEITQNVQIPVLRKDFTVNDYMIYEAKILGASAVLLICSILSEQQLREYLELAHALGLSALVEAHDEAEIETAVKIGAKIIGVNNRDLKTFSVDTGNSAHLRGLVPPDRIFVSESGIRTAADVDGLRKIGANAALIGETLMRAPDKKAKLDELRGAK